VFVWTTRIVLVCTVCHRAVKNFSCAIRVDPTCIQAYICRAEAYQHLSDVSLSLLADMFEIPATVSLETKTVDVLDF